MTSIAKCRKRGKMGKNPLIHFAGLLSRTLLGELAGTFEETRATLKSYVRSSIEINASMGEVK